MLKYRGQQINDTDVSIGKTAPQMRTIPVNVRECSASYCQLKLPADPWGSLKEEVYPAAQEVYDVFLHRSGLWLFHPFICLLLLPLPFFFRLILSYYSHLNPSFPFMCLISIFSDLFLLHAELFSFNQW